MGAAGGGGAADTVCAWGISRDLISYIRAGPVCLLDDQLDELDLCDESRAHTQ